MRFYDLLLRLFPKSFRLEYGDEMRRLFDGRLSATNGPFARPALWIETLADIIPNAAYVHWDILRQDLTFTARTLSRSPGFTVTAIVVAALGIGATTAAFSVTDRALLRDLPFRDADRLVKIWQSDAAFSRFEPSPGHYRDWKQMASSFEGIGAYSIVAGSITGRGEPMRVEGTTVTANLLPILGATPLVGRLFTPEEDQEGAAGTMILSYGLWMESFGGAASAVGSKIYLDEKPYTIVGVMPRDFSFPDRFTRIWVPLRMEASWLEDRTNAMLRLVAKLKPGVTLDSARADMSTVTAQLKRQYAKENDASVVMLRDEVPSQARVLLLALFGAALCVLLIACTNLASLLIARSLQRRKELAVRVAIGAGRERLVRQLVTESVILALIGGVVGIALAYLATPLLGQVAPVNLPLADTTSIDARILAFAAFMTLATGIGFGVVPALALNGDKSLDGLREGARGGVGGRRRMRSALVLAEVAISVVLLVSCGLLVRALWQVQQTDPGFRADGVLTARTSLPMPRYAPTAERGRFYDNVLTEIRAIPGVKSAGFISFLPMVARGGIWQIQIPGRTEDRANDKVSMRFVTPQYFGAMGIQLITGRDFNEFDTRKAPSVIVVSQSFANKYWPGQDPLGRTVNITFEDRVIVGVVADVKVRGLERVSEPQVYLGHLQINDGFVEFYAPRDLAIRVSGNPATIAGRMREIVKRVDPLVPISDVRTLEDIVHGETTARSVQLTILQAFALIATLLAGVGLHGLIAFTVSNRLQEIAVRMTLGASRRQIIRLVLDDGVRLAVIGVLVGLVLAYAAGQSMAALLAGLSPADLPVFAVSAGVVALMAIGGSLAPALRAVRVNPTSVMRTE